MKYANSVPNSIGPGGWGGDWYVWDAPDGLRARAATALGCMQAGAEKLGVIEASYASAIIGVLSPVSSLLIVYDAELSKKTIPASSLVANLNRRLRGSFCRRRQWGAEDLS